MPCSPGGIGKLTCTMEPMAGMAADFDTAWCAGILGYAAGAAIVC